MTTKILNYSVMKTFLKHYLDVFVEVSELIHVGKGFDTSPGCVAKEVNCTGDVEHHGVAQEEVELGLIYFVAYQENLKKTQNIKCENISSSTSTL